MNALAAHFVQMARNNRWSNHVLLRACARLDPEAFRAARISFFPSIEATLRHNLFIDLFYVDAPEEGGRGLAVFEGDGRPFGHASELAAPQEAVDRRLIAFCESLGDDDPARKVITDRGEDGPIPERIDNLLAHLFQHQIHHRGQVHAMLQEPMCRRRSSTSSSWISTAIRRSRGWWVIKGSERRRN